MYCISEGLYHVIQRREVTLHESLSVCPWFDFSQVTASLFFFEVSHSFDRTLRILFKIGEQRIGKSGPLRFWDEHKSIPSVMIAVIQSLQTF